MREGQKTTTARSLRQNLTGPERLLWYALKDRRFAGIKFRRQVPIGPYVADFASVTHKLIVEVDGGQHSDSVRDELRDLYLIQQGWTVLRFWNNEVIGNREGVLMVIGNHLGIAQ